MQISNNANDQDIVIQTDDGSGGATTYFRKWFSLVMQFYIIMDQKKIKTLNAVAETGNLTVNNGTNLQVILNVDTGVLKLQEVEVLLLILKILHLKIMMLGYRLVVI